MRSVPFFPLLRTVELEAPPLFPFSGASDAGASLGRGIRASAAASGVATTSALVATAAPAAAHIEGGTRRFLLYVIFAPAAGFRAGP
ncbi:MAG TPA: hypothetical protein VH231_21630 [Solirubrobacteraceae bacterium]|jgi:hypothetical protein|nr:hypothetical protein [Solirubrobacteraceae bacterium]